MPYIIHMYISVEMFINTLLYLLDDIIEEGKLCMGNVSHLTFQDIYYIKCVITLGLIV